MTIIIIIIMLTVICRQNILRTITIKEDLILVTNILDQMVLKVWEYSLFHLSFKNIKIFEVWNLINNNNKY